MKHKHYDCIVAWAEGKEIQVRWNKGAWFKLIDSFWSDSDEVEYRIKPEKKESMINIHRAARHAREVLDYVNRFLNMNKTIREELVKEAILDLDKALAQVDNPVWFGLTGTEIRQLKDIHIPMYSTPTIDDYFNFYRAIEDALKDKNTTHHLQHDK